MDADTIDLRPDRSAFWKGAGAVLATIIAGGTIAGVLSNAFFVRRDEYTTRATQDSLSISSLQRSVEVMTDTLRAQQASFLRMSETLADVKTELAVLKSQKR